MTDPQPRESSVPELPKDESGKSPDPNTDATSLPVSAADASAASAPAESNKLSAEEQMALYEQDLKENDWGHQPC
jgi:hypothetical protein